MSEYSFIGYIVGRDARVSDDYRRKVKLRETKTLYVSESGRRFKKSNLAAPGLWPMYQLESEPVRIPTTNHSDGQA